MGKQQAKQPEKKGAWDASEDELLLKVIHDIVSSGAKLKWCHVAKKLPLRSPKQCRERYVYNLDPNINKNPWTKEEDALLICAQKQLGNSWARIASCLPGRTENSTKTRFKSLIRAQKRAWKPEEDALIQRMHAEYGSRWDFIATHLTGRTKNAVKTRFRFLAAGGVGEEINDDSIIDETSPTDQHSMNLLQTRLSMINNNSSNSSSSSKFVTTKMDEDEEEEEEEEEDDDDDDEDDEDDDEEVEEADEKYKEASEGPKKKKLNNNKTSSDLMSQDQEDSTGDDEDSPETPKNLNHKRAASTDLSFTPREKSALPHKIRKFTLNDSKDDVEDFAAEFLPTLLRFDTLTPVVTNIFSTQQQPFLLPSVIPISSSQTTATVPIAAPLLSSARPSFNLFSTKQESDIFGNLYDDEVLGSNSIWGTSDIDFSWMNGAKIV